jgi:hypothetical protein
MMDITECSDEVRYHASRTVNTKGATVFRGDFEKYTIKEEKAAIIARRAEGISEGKR